MSKKKNSIVKIDLSNENQYRWVIETRENYNNGRIRHQEKLDKYLLTLSGGAFGLTFAFIDHFITGTIKIKFLLLSGYSLFAASILFTLISFYLSQRAYNAQLKDFDKMITAGEYDHEAPIRYEKAINRINLFSFSSFISAVICVIIFTGFNL